MWERTRLCGHVWKHVGEPCANMDATLRRSGQTMDLTRETPHTYLGLHEPLWIHMDPHEMLWVSKVLRGHSWTSVVDMIGCPTRL